MLQKTDVYMKEQKVNLQDEKILIGLSGGMDSVCLFHILRELGCCLEAVHVNHGIRGEEANRDEAFVKMLCEKYDVPFHGFRFDVPEFSKRNHMSIEEAGRMIRREVFEEVSKACDANYIALAHHGNDNVETMLMRLLRGSSLSGYSGMQELTTVNDRNIIRPFLNISKDDICKYQRENNVEYYEDITNNQRDYTRNRIRMEIAANEAKENVLALLKQSVRPEFLNRIDEIIMFLPLNKEEIKRIN